MYNDRNLIDRRNVSADVSHRVNPCKRFFALTIRARVVAATMKILGMEEIDGMPENYELSVNANSDKRVKRKFIQSLAARVVDEFILRSSKVEDLLKKKEREEENQKEASQCANDRFQCHFPGCKKTYKHNGKARRDHEATHGLPVNTISSSSSVNTTHQAKMTNDDMLNYQHSLLEIGLLIQNFYDSVSEGDGCRVLRCWKFFLPYLQNDGSGSTKYALEALFVICQANALLSPKAAHQLTWNRFSKTKNGPGGNIPLDLALEHHNRLIKTVMRNLGPNASSSKALDRYCKALEVNKNALENFDHMVSFKTRSGEHRRRVEKTDLKKIVSELIKTKHFVTQKGGNINIFQA